MYIFILLIGIIDFAIGVAIGTQLSLLNQLTIFVIGILYLNSSHVAAMEIGSIFPYMLIMVLFAGIIVGDISYIIQTKAWVGMNLHNPFIVTK